MRHSHTVKAALIAAMILCLAGGGCSQWRRNREMQGDAATVRRILENRYDRVRLDVKPSEDMGRREAGIHIIYETRNIANIPERHREIYDILLTCHDHIKAPFDFVRIDAQKTNRNHDKVLKKYSYNYEYWQIKKLAAKRTELGLPKNE